MAVVRISGATLPPQKHIDVALATLYGVGRPLAQQILRSLNIPFNVKTDALDNAQVSALREIIEKKYPVEGELHRRIMMNIKRLKDIGSYRGLRHSKGLPVRGQRTKTNSRTRRGNVRRTMGSGRKSASEKT
ncbi:MAG: 30S ribosomal protein S13 [bacterium]|nr:30S ribosomal protein S13 [bacterium]